MAILDVEIARQVTAMEPSKRAALVQFGHDQRTVDALLRVPPIISGLTPEQVSSLTEIAVARRHPDQARDGAADDRRQQHHHRMDLERRAQRPGTDRVLDGAVGDQQREGDDEGRRGPARAEGDQHRERAGEPGADERDERERVGDPLLDALDLALGQAWDEELEPFRYAGAGAPVRWLHRVG